MRVAAQERYDLHSYSTELTVIQNLTTRDTMLVARGDEPSEQRCERRTFDYSDMNSTMCALLRVAMPRSLTVPMKAVAC